VSSAPVASAAVPVVVLDASAAIAITLPDEPLCAEAHALVADLDAQGARLVAPPLYVAETDTVLMFLKRCLYSALGLPDFSSLLVHRPMWKLPEDI